MDTEDVVRPPHVTGPLRIRPFHGIGLAAHRVGDPASGRILGRPFHSVPARLARWESSGDLVRDAEPAIYLHEYTAGGITVRGLVGALDVTPPTASSAHRAVLPHEGVHQRQVEQLAHRMETMEVNPAPILMVHRARPALRSLLEKIREGAPSRAYDDRAGQHHRLWAMRDHTTLDALAEHLAGATALIADGHHRLAAYLRLQRAHPGTAYDSGLAMLVDHEDTPLFLGAVHRVLEEVPIDDLVAAAVSAGADVTAVTTTAALGALGPDVLVVTDRGAWHVVRWPVPGELAVEVLHREILRRLRAVPALSHHHNVESALDRVASAHGVAVLLPAPSVDQVLRAAVAGRLLPEKATSFQPKPSPGVLMRSLRDG